LALALAAARPDVEIVSLDSMQVYRGMDVCTAKATPAERAAVRHHLIDVARPSETWSVARAQRAARAAVADIEARGKCAVLVGGTGLYVRAVVDGLAIPGEDGAVRAELETAVATAGGGVAAHAELTRRDPAAAARIDPRNVRRVVRALEVVRATGKPFSSSGPGIGTFGRPGLDVLMVGVWLPRPVVDRRIHDRLEAMRHAGIVDEVAALAARIPAPSRTARQAIGYREIVEHLSGTGARPSLDDALAAAARRTRAFARRQRMWFRRDPRIRWLGTSDNPASLLPGLLAGWAP